MIDRAVARLKCVVAPEVDSAGPGATGGRSCGGCAAACRGTVCHQLKPRPRRRGDDENRTNAGLGGLGILPSTASARNLWGTEMTAGSPTQLDRSSLVDPPISHPRSRMTGWAAYLTAAGGGMVGLPSRSDSKRTCPRRQADLSNRSV
ncbi:hypothetical protein PCANC_07191 [Puccinia coronata f. sp. avenae]|uniref:Uncharacterized protein n=1 Tax=Puccinia coronata f. sp. avenae TaxID=200324 RepID=A0A2N5VU62_9BASI|nr:hypothetical protein PCASD_14516 [Puccinia coronata f. sp. avenae]PLW50304.1 hypothetical protein PCASD_01666 [Puccinia coronata f. sp. avenae]PLW53511.1 hypothetical protein PCANC_07191 [Puccinia coronata f. sp. avenae]